MAALLRGGEEAYFRYEIDIDSGSHICLTQKHKYSAICPSSTSILWFYDSKLRKYALISSKGQGKSAS